VDNYRVTGLDERRTVVRRPLRRRDERLKATL
jgi:hypothetical protein